MKFFLQSDGNQSMIDTKQHDGYSLQAEPVAWMTHHDEPLLFLTEIEAAEYCDDDERPIPLYAVPQQEQS